MNDDLAFHGYAPCVLEKAIVSLKAIVAKNDAQLTAKNSVPCKIAVST